jgi:ATP phosphoribosyltransferase regulatory subunit
MPTKDRWLLPDGIEEVLPDEARRLERMRRRALDQMAGWGYELVMPPLIEYLEALLTGSGKDLDLRTFKLTDQLTGRLMGVRPDMTPQAARIDAHYLKRATPVRLCYLGPVLHTLPGDFGGSREPLQLGAELFGHGGVESDAEILALMIATLRAAGIASPHVDLGHVGVFRGLARVAELGPDTEADVFDALQRKARGDLDDLLPRPLETTSGARASARKSATEGIAALLDYTGDTDVLKDARDRYAEFAEVTEALDHLTALVQLMQRDATAPTLHIDLSELSGYHYYTGVVFSAFVPGCGRAIAKGGRYDGIGRAFGRDRAATGFGADLRQLLRVGESGASALTGILAPHDGNAALLAEVARLRSGGERVVMDLPGGGGGAKDYGCDRVLVQRGGRWVVEQV